MVFVVVFFFVLVLDLAAFFLLVNFFAFDDLLVLFFEEAAFLSILVLLFLLLFVALLALVLAGDGFAFLDALLALVFELLDTLFLALLGSARQWALVLTPFLLTDALRQVHVELAPHLLLLKPEHWLAACKVEASISAPAMVPQASSLPIIFIVLVLVATSVVLICWANIGQVACQL